MRIYLAGLKLENSTKLMIKKGVHKLCSYAYPEQLVKYCSYFKDIEEIDKLGTLLIDSGAFTMWSKNRMVNIDQYIDYCKMVVQKFGCYFDEIHPVNLDVIPGQKGRRATKEEKAQSAIDGYKNFEYMRRRGLRPVHVFHSGEDYKWLQRLIDDKAEYIGVSPSNDYSMPERMEWLHNCFQIICDSQGVPKIKCHAFGVTAIEPLRNFPWFSADSAAWSLSSGYGMMKTPYGQVDISFRRRESDNSLKKRPRHSQEAIIRWVEEKGIKFSDLQFDYKLRDEVNIHYYLWLQDKLANMNRNYKQKQMTLFKEFNEKEIDKEFETEGVGSF